MDKYFRLLTDLFRVGILLVATGVGLYLMDEANVVVFQSLGVALFMVGGTHLTRRILFPHVDLQAVAKRAYNDNSVAAAIVFAAMVAFLISVMFLSIGMLR